MHEVVGNSTTIDFRSLDEPRYVMVPRQRRNRCRGTKRLLWR